MLKGTYIDRDGKRPFLKDKTAIIVWAADLDIRNDGAGLVRAQFDNLSLPFNYTHSWMLWGAEDFRYDDIQPTEPMRGRDFRRFVLTPTAKSSDLRRIRESIEFFLDRPDQYREHMGFESVATDRLFLAYINAELARRNAWR